MVVGRARGFYPIICTSPIKSGPSQRTVHVTPSSIDFSDSRPSSSASSASATSSSSVFASWLKRDTGRHQQQQKQQQPQKQTSRLATQVVTINDANAQVEEEEDGASIASSTDCDRRRRSLHNIRKSIPPRSDSTLRWSNGVTMIEKQQHQQLRVDDDNDDEVMMNDQVAREGDVSTSSSIATADMKYPVCDKNVPRF